MGEKEENLKIVISEKVYTLEQAKKKFRYVTLSNNPNVGRILSVLSKADRPLRRTEIAERVDISRVYTIRLLNDMIDGGFVAEFRMGSRVYYYALTEKGHDTVKKIEET